MDRFVQHSGFYFFSVACEHQLICTFPWAANCLNHESGKMLWFAFHRDVSRRDALTHAKITSSALLLYGVKRIHGRHAWWAHTTGFCDKRVCGVGHVRKSFPPLTAFAERSPIRTCMCVRNDFWVRNFKNKWRHMYTQIHIFYFTLLLFPFFFILTIICENK